MMYGLIKQNPQCIHFSFTGDRNLNNINSTTQKKKLQLARLSYSYIYIYISVRGEQLIVIAYLIKV